MISAVTGTGGLIRIMRGNLLETLGQPFVEAARARGLKNSSVIWKHAVRIAINPLIVILGSEALPGIISGGALVSIVLNLPTIGPLFVDSLRKLDMYHGRHLHRLLHDPAADRQPAGRPGAGVG